MNLEKQKEHFKNHKATFTDYGNIKILDFKAPNTNDYRIRFLFEEDYCRLHISGDLGELIATNYDNMTYEHFTDFVNSIDYFESKIDCHNRPIYEYDVVKARKDIKEYLEENGYIENIVSNADYSWYDTEEEALNEFLNEVLYDFNYVTGIGYCGYEKLNTVCSDIWEVVGDFGKTNTGILDLYMLAFKLAQNDLKK
ncbi:MAG: hypothetical protein IJT36_01710 [Alphaproteobacteria bacterium]|nr:hypothetical protein [Alphaproteobacteria bacterium]